MLRTRSAASYVQESFWWSSSTAKIGVVSVLENNSTNPSSAVPPLPITVVRSGWGGILGVVPVHAKLIIRAVAVLGEVAVLRLFCPFEKRLRSDEVGACTSWWRLYCRCGFCDDSVRQLCLHIAALPLTFI